LLAKPVSAPDLVSELETAHRVLEELAPCKSEARYKTLHAALAKKTDELSEQAVEHAQAKAEKGELEKAIEIVKVAERFGSKQLATKAAQIRQQWVHELKLRNDREAQRKLLSQIEALQQQGELLQAWQQLSDFMRRFPETFFPEEVDRLRATLEQTIRKRAPEYFKLLKSYQQSEKWGDLVRLYQQLVSAPLPEQYAARLEAYRRAVTDLGRQADSLFLSLDFHKRMTTRESVVKLLEVLPRVLALNPDHQEAKQLLEQARQAGARYAEKLLRLAYLLHKQNQIAKCRERLEEIILLDPDGPAGKEAREFLEQLSGK
jgi:tetratricopeptide (TPR) repeat protein